MRSSTPQVKFNSAAILLARKRAGLTQEALGQKLDVSTRTIQYWELGRIEPSAQNFLLLCKLFDLSPDDLYSVDEAAA